MRYQSNANLGPATSDVRLFGQAANLNQQAVGAPDWGVVSTVQLRHTYDLGTQDKAALETIFTGYVNRQFQQSAANVSLLDLTSGPRFQVFNGIFEDVSLKPFGAFGAIWVNDTPYYTSYGGGVEANALLSDRLRNITTAVWRKHDNNDTSYLPTNSLFRGTEYTGNTILPYQLDADRHAVRQRQRPALPDRAGAVAELSAVGRRRRHELPLPRSGAQDRPALDHQPDRQRAVVALRCARPDRRPDRLPRPDGFHRQPSRWRSRSTSGRPSAFPAAASRGPPRCPTMRSTTTT